MEVPLPTIRRGKIDVDDTGGTRKRPSAFLRSDIYAVGNQKTYTYLKNNYKKSD